MNGTIIHFFNAIPDVTFFKNVTSGIASTPVELWMMYETITPIERINIQYYD